MDTSKNAAMFSNGVCYSPFDILCIDMYTYNSCEIRTPPYTGQLSVVPVVALVQRSHCTGQLTVVPHIDMYTVESSKIRTPPYTGQLTVVPVVALLQRFHSIIFHWLVIVMLCNWVEGTSYCFFSVRMYLIVFGCIIFE